MSNALADNLMGKRVQRELHESKDIFIMPNDLANHPTVARKHIGILGNNLSEADDTVTDLLEVW